MRPARVASARLLEEVVAAGAEQVIIVSANADTDAAAHADRAAHRRARPPRRLAGVAGDGRGARRGAGAAGRLPSIHVISPAHNPIGPFDLVGAYDERSDRVQLLGELLDRGYADAYHQFIEPVVGAAEPTS